MPLRKVHELTFLWFGLPGPLLTKLALDENQVLLKRHPNGYQHKRLPKCLVFDIQKLAILKIVHFDAPLSAFESLKTLYRDARV